MLGLFPKLLTPPPVDLLTLSPVSQHPRPWSQMTTAGLLPNGRAVLSMSDYWQNETS